VELKRQTVQAAAQDAVESGSLVTRYGNAAWIAEITQAQMKLATTPDAGKSSVMAAQWLVSNAGMDEKQQQDQAQPTVGDMARLVDALAGFVAAAAPSVIDAYPLPDDEGGTGDDDEQGGEEGEADG